jgi:hypothetical protein
MIDTPQGTVVLLPPRHEEERISHPHIDREAFWNFLDEIAAERANERSTKMHDVKIHAVLNGWVVEVGCHTVVYTSADDLLKDLGLWLNNPPQTEKVFVENALNAKFVNGPTPEAAPERSE